MPILLCIAIRGVWMGMWDTRFGMPARVPVKARRRDSR
jgi:hypothetical protein